MSTEHAAARAGRRRARLGMAGSALVVLAVAVGAVAAGRSAVTAAALVTASVLAQAAALAVASSLRSKTVACVPHTGVCVGG